MLPCKKLLNLLLVLLIITPSYGGGLSEYEGKVWKLLLHFRDGESSIDDPEFFLDPQGKRDPWKELETTVRALKENPALRCRFPARAFFLENYLGMSLPEMECPELRQFLSELKGSRLSLVFADSHINSPASMFGHTFLRIYEKEGDLFSYIVNYAAKVDDSNALLYAFKGLFGYYRGVYSVAPFYAKIREYSGIEGRDLWEYEVEIGERELKLFKLHLWELKNTYSYYYFFHENCSTEVFYLLNFARPEEELGLKTPWTVPVDTVKALFAAGMVKRISYEPSLLSRLKSRVKFLSEEELRVVLEWATGNERLPKDGDHHLYEFASDYVRFLYYGRAMDRNAYRRKFLEALRLRSRVGKAEDIEFRGEPPHSSHGSQRFYLSAGFREGDGFLEVAYRPVYHDLLDPPGGYKRNAEIVFSEVAFRFFPDRRKAYLERWRLIRITSVEPLLPFYRPLFWKVDFGVYRIIDPEGERRAHIYLNSGGGYTFSLGDLSLFILPEARAFFRDRAVVGAGVQAGTLLQGNTLSLLLTATGGKYLYNFEREEYLQVKGGLSLHLSERVSLRGEGLYDKVGRVESSEVSISALLYF